MIIDVLFPNEYSFIGNPMPVHIKGYMAEEVIIDVNIGNENIASLSVVLFGTFGNCHGKVDIGNILVSFFGKYKTLPNAVDVVNDFCINYSISVQNKSGSEVITFSGKAFYGGISQYNYQWLKANGMDMFGYRLMNPERQFLFTTRTNSNHLILRETELEPLIFIHPAGEISVTSPYGRQMFLRGYPHNTICSFDISAIRKEYFLRHNELLSFFAVMLNKKNVFDVTIIPNQIAEENYLLKFKNSLGVYELIEVTGRADDVHTFSEEELWESVNEYDVFEENRSRITSRQTISVETGYKSRDELCFLIDMVKSDDIYLIDSADPLKREYRCLVAPEELTLPKRITEPQSFKLKVRMVTEGCYESPDIIFDESLPLFQNLTIPGDPRINRYGLILRYDHPFYSK